MNQSLNSNNILIKLFIFLGLIMINIACSTVKPNTNISYTITGGNSSYIKFNVYKDGNISQNDPRIRSIIEANKLAQNSTINIAFTTFEGHQLANQIANIIIRQAGIVRIPVKQNIIINNKPESYIVLVWLSYTPLTPSKLESKTTSKPKNNILLQDIN